MAYQRNKVKRISVFISTKLFIDKLNLIILRFVSRNNHLKNNLNVCQQNLIILHREDKCPYQAIRVKYIHMLLIHQSIHNSPIILLEKSPHRKKW